MNLSPGLLYSAQKLVDMVVAQPMTRDDFLWAFHTVLVSPADGVLALSTRCGWIGINEELGLDVTDLGRRVQSHFSPEEKLRQQIKDFIQSVQPPWARLLPFGRAEAMPFMPENARQCFTEAGLSIMPPSDAIIAWWDDLAAAARARHADSQTQIGRDGERCSIRYEEARVGRRPEWHSIESNKSGFDLASIVSRENPIDLQIEVKASERPISAATCHVTRNEWEVAVGSESYLFHLWSMTEAGNKLAILKPQEVECHVPTENGEGRWESVEIPFRVFRPWFQEVSS